MRFRMIIKIVLAGTLAVLAYPVAAYADDPRLPANATRCPTGNDLSGSAVHSMQKDLYATIVRRYGVDSDLAKAFVPGDELEGAKSRAQLMPPAYGEDNSVDDALKAITSAELSNGDKAARPPQAPPVTIDTWIHIIKSTSGQGGVTSQQVLDQVNALNRAYSGPGFQFRLVGTTVTANDKFFSAGMNTVEEIGMKTTLRKGGAKVLNLYVNAIAGDVLGYATFPSGYSSFPQGDGIVVHYQTFPGGSYAPYNLGNTAAHEVGHWLGLYHTFQGGCSQNGNTGGDTISDTPAQASPTFGCPKSRNSCSRVSGKDPINNFMDYTNDACMKSFTHGQTKRMKASWVAFRHNK